MKIKEKISNLINLPIILFIIIFINYLPLIIKNIATKKSFSVNNFQIILCFFIEIIILIIYYLKKYIKNKEKNILKNNIKLNIIILLLNTAILIIAQLLNFSMEKNKILDIFNIGCIFLNIFFFYICILNIKIEEKNIYYFFKAIIFFTLFSCLINFILYYKEMYNFFINGKYSWNVMIKSFFANRNQYAFVLYIGIISNLIIIKSEKNIFYKISLIVFIINLFSTGSRTGVGVSILLFIFIFLINNKIKLKNKIILCTLIVLLFIISGAIIYNLNPNIITKINNNIIRIGEIKNLSGRTIIWNEGINILNKKTTNLLFGAGRFQATKVLENINGKEFTQFHSIYLDILTTGGITEFIYIGFIYFSVVKNILKSKLERKYKECYIAMYLSYAIYIALESFGRFSIGCSDTLCLIFFITIPLLHSNSIKK